MVSHELRTPITVVLGIAQTLVDRLVRGMGGQVWVEDNPGGGARFVVELPDLSSV
jgi:signal transduction histidine kinase